MRAVPAESTRSRARITRPPPPFVDVAEHHDGRQQQRRRVRDAFAGDVGRAAVDGFEDGAVGAEVGRAHDAKAADEAGAQVRDDVAVQVRHHQHVEPFRVQHELHAGGVDDALVVGDVRKLARDGPDALEKQSVAELHDVGLVNRRHASCARAGARSSNANCAMRVEARSVMIFRLSTTPGTTSCSSPA